MFDYHVGDTVIYPNYGLGEIIQMDVKFINGRQMDCYVVQLQNMFIWAMAEEPGKSGLRLPTSSVDFDNMLAILSSPGVPLPAERFVRKRELIQRLKSGALTSICTVIRDLTLHMQKNKVNEDDKTIMQRAKDFLLEEWLYARPVSREQANEELTRLLGVVYA